MPDGKPMIGSVPGLQNLYLAAGHEGGGLSMVSNTHPNVLSAIKKRMVIIGFLTSF